MKLLIKIFFLLAIVLFTILIIWADPILEKAGSRILNTPVKINQVRFSPAKLCFELYGIDIREKNILFPSGELHLILPGLKLHGLKLMENILGEKNFCMEISRHRNWEINIFVKGADLSRAGFGFEKGEISGDIEGIYRDGSCILSGIMRLKNVVFSDTDSEFLGMSAEEFEEILKIYKGEVELDFTYRGPPDEIDNPSNYSPGRKSINLLAAIAIVKLSK